MEEIKINRIKGYLNLDSYFYKRLKREAIDVEDLELSGIVEVEPLGISEKFWILSSDNNERIALFKEEAPLSSESYAELFSEEIAKILGMPTAHYDLATFNGKKGVISYNFVKEDDNFYSFSDIILDFYDDKLENNEELGQLYGISEEDTIEEVVSNLTNLQDIWCILDDKFKDNCDRRFIVGKIVNSLVDKLIFDILTVNVDDHSENFGIVSNLENKGELSPQFDNARILNLHQNILNDEYKNVEMLTNKRLELTVDNSSIKKPLEVLKHFLDISSSEYRELVNDKINALKNNIDLIPSIIENRTEHPIPDYLKTYFTDTLHEHLDNASKVISGKEKGAK